MFCILKMSNIYLPAKVMGEERPKSFPVQFTKEELKARLTPEQYHVTQERGTER